MRGDEEKSTAKDYENTFWGEEAVLHFDAGGSYTLCMTTKTHQTIHLNAFTYFMYYSLYVNNV